MGDYARISKFASRHMMTIIRYEQSYVIIYKLLLME